MFDWFPRYSGGWEASADRLLPFVDHVTDHSLLLRDGSRVAALRFSGVPYCLVDDNDRGAQFRRHVAFLNAASDENVEIYEHLVSHSSVSPLPKRPADVAPYATRLLADYHADVNSLLRGLDWFMFIRVKPRLGELRIPVISRLLSPAPDTEGLERQLDDIVALARTILARFEPHRLGLRTEGGVVFSAMMEAQHLVLTTRFVPQPLVDPAGTLGAGLYTFDAICGRRGFELRFGPKGTDSTYGAMGGLRVHPRALNVATLDELLSIEGRFVITNAIRCHTRAEAQDALTLLRRQMVTADDPAASSADELREAIDALASGRAERGRSRWSFAAHGDTPREVDQIIGQARNIMATSGAKFTVEGIGTTASYWAQIIGGPEGNWIRPALFDMRQFATFTTLSGFPVGATKPRWGHLFRMATTGLTPFDHDQFVGDVGHMVIIAPNGTGKTIVVGFSIAALDALVRGSGGTQIILDVDQSNANVIRALEGQYVDIRSAEDSGVAPLRLPNTPRVRLMLRQFVAALCQWDGGPGPNPGERTGIEAGVEFVMSEVAPADRSFATVRQFMGFGEGGAGARFESWCRGGEYGWAFDGERHDLDFSAGLVGVDLTQVMNDKVVMPPMATLLLWMASEVMDGRRCVVWAEEAPAYLPEPRFASMFKGIALRARKRNAAFIAVAQMPEHLLQNEAGKAIVKQARQIIALPNDKAEREDYCIGMGFTEPEFDKVREGMMGLGYRSVLVKRLDGQSSVNRFDLSAHPEHIAVLSSTPKSAALFKSIIEANPGREMAGNLAEFWRRLPEMAA